MDEGFVGKINGPFICLTAAILCHSVQCWRTGNFIDNLACTRASSKGKTTKADLRIPEVSGSLGPQGRYGRGVARNKNRRDQDNIKG